MEHQSLYRRYRPSCFGELIGQQHVVAALRNSVRDDKVGHAYLFSGPRGTGKTSTARILAKAINCENPSDGEPCGECDSCLSFAAGTSYDLHELDAASNNKVEDIRDLISKVSFGTPGRRKVYVLDEVHMLTTGAENALLKTLEEPPAHVCFVMCTTEPHKVAATVRSRAQHLLFELVTADELAEHVRWVAEDAELSLSEDDLDYAVRAGNGSVRDTLSALDQVVSAEGKPDDDDLIEEFVAALASHDTGKMLAASDAAIRSGKEPRVIGEEIVGALRSAFLCSVGADLSHLLPQEQAQAQARAAQLPTATITKTFEELGQALVHMRQSPDPRIDLELAFFRLSENTGAAPAPPRGTPKSAGQTSNSAGQRGETRRAETNHETGNQSRETNHETGRQSRETNLEPARQSRETEHEPARQSEPESSSYADRETVSNADIEETHNPPPPIERNPSRVQRAREQIREELRSSNPRSAPTSPAYPSSSPPRSPPESSSYDNPPATSNPAPTLGAIRRRRAAEQSETATRSGQPATQAEAVRSYENQENPESHTAHPEPQAAQPEPPVTHPEPQAVHPEPQTAYPEPPAAHPEPQAAHPEPPAAHPEPQAAHPEPPAAHPEQSQAPASPASQSHDTTSTAPHSNPRKSTAEAVGISEETMALVEEYFPDAKAVELPESVRQMTPRATMQASSQQPAASASPDSTQPSSTHSTSADSAQPNSTHSTSPDNTQPNSTATTTENAQSIPSGPLPSRDEVTVAWGNEIFDSLSPPLKRRFSVARFLESQDDAVRLAMPAAAVGSITPEQHQEVEARLAEHFGYQVAVLLVEDDRSTPTPPDPEVMISKDAADISPDIPADRPDIPADRIFANGTEISNETSSLARAESANGVGTGSETDSTEDKLLKAISHDAAMTIEAEALETPLEVNPNIPQDSLFG